jgi:NADH-quinone oxidoreductase subunit G
VPDRAWITFSIDGREVRAPEGEWLLDAAKRGDVEIPYFCYEKKLGAPVGACRMCMVEVEGIPKLQTSCSTPVKDGMVVHTQTDRVKDAQNAVVEFLLVNHPLDCPVCDKGGECPLQDISYGWGPGRSRFVEEKRQFPKPIALSPLIAIDRERCILCYRCVRFSQEVAEDEQLVFVERADHTFVGTFDGHPYVAPFSGNVIELCPVGALTNTAYRFRARPWDIEGAGSVCNLCPSQCNVEFTVRDERVERVLARDNPDVDDGWLCDKGRWGYQAIASEERITQPLIRDGGALRPTTWEKALDAAAAGLAKAGAGASAIVGGSATNEEAYLVQRIFREALGSGSIDSRPGGALPPRAARSMTHPDLGAAVADLDRASAVLVLEADPLEEAPILDLRVRKAVGRFGARLVVASSAPTALDGGATEVLRFAPGAAETLLRGLQKALVGSAAEAPENGSAAGAEGALAGHAELAEFLAANQLDRLAERAGIETQDLLDVAALLTAADNVIVIWGERLGFGERGPGAVDALLDLALLLGLDAASGSGMLEIPSGANGRGLREVGCLPGLGPGLADAPSESPAQDAAMSGGGAPRAFFLLHVDPLRELPGQPEWEAALDAAPFVVAHAQFLDESLAHHVDVVFPGEAYAEKEGTLTHPDGRLQRLRPSIGHPGEVRMEWQVLIDLARRLGLEGVGADSALPVTAAAVFAELSEQVPFYRGLTLDDIGGDGLRWPAREQSAAAARQAFGALGFSSPAEPPAPLEPAKGILRLAPRPALWASWVIERSPSLRFLAASQVVELNPLDAERLGLASGDEAQVRAGEQSVTATVRVRRGVARGTATMLLGTAADNANLLVDSAPVLIEIEKLPAGSREGSATAAVGLTEGSP